ncbi:MAG TPA: carbon-nitrogen hydrolase family protein [Alphaproteobacteria bacterium]|nr:carbon-nitrogen hydrolase family protein [Alphaproteobacteria bacterium]HOO52041.1 carbon-nitrogen hydrolase family protein [Alphaproteobacteria bacterium]
MSIRVAALQMTSGPEMDVNLAVFEALVRSAAMQGAVFICSPENTDLLGLSAQDKIGKAHAEEGHPFLVLSRDLAKELSIWISIGSLAIPDGLGKVFNRSYLISNQGRVVSSYDKIHLFDVCLPDGEVRCESDMVRAGTHIVVADADFSKIGMSICYDVRFPYLYRSLAREGAGILLVPSAFTVSTGQAHWEVLLRARAIENGCFVIASAQCGEHGGGRKTYGHSLIISPWGKILAEAGEGQGVILADLDLSEIQACRDAIPCLLHERVIS